MNITFNEIENILNTLPVSYYVKRKVTCEFSKDARTSFYSPIEDKIVVSANNVIKALKVLDENALDYETAVRTPLYHEVSHAILTPMGLTDYMNADTADIINIFEDERIETLLDNYYMNTDFKTFKKSLKTEESQTAIDYFFDLVRFRYFPLEPSLVDRVSNIINDYKHLSRKAGSNNMYSYEISNYVKAIRKLYMDMQNILSANNVPVQPKENSVTQNLDCVESNEKEDKKSASKPMPKDFDKMMKPGKNTVKAILEKEEITELLETTTNELDNAELSKPLEIIISNFKKKNSGGSALYTYSGVINPRLVARDDYRYFERMAVNNGNNRFGSCHLNLFIDKSGSFVDNTRIVNQLLYALKKIADKNSFFTFDVCFMGDGQTIAKNTREKTLKCGGGNNLTNKIYEQFKSLQKPNTYNYNIVLFDGEAYPDSSNRNNKHTTFDVFNNSNCTIITDRDNKRYVDKDCQSAKVIITRHYVSEFIDNIVKTFTKAFS